jgi:outer membrane beta-barrel protein
MKNRIGSKVWALLLILSVGLVGSLSTATAQESEAVTEDDGDYDFSWLDPEKKIYVLQNRRYLKTEHMMVSLSGGPSTGSAYRASWHGTARLGYYFNEWLGLEGNYTLLVNNENKTFEALRVSTSNIIPIVREVRSQASAMLNFVPWYAKINMFNQIIYFDWYFGVGVGIINTRVDTRNNAALAPNYVNENFTGLMVGTGHIYHISDALFAKLEVQAAYYNAGNFGVGTQKSWFSSYTYGLGLGVKF